MGLNFDYENGQTPIAEDEKEGLKIPSITTLKELDEFEQLNIQKAVAWSLSGRIRTEEILTEQFIRSVHHRMYSDVWKWAGQFRLTNKNIGVDKFEIGVQVRLLLSDTEYRIQHSVFPPDDIAVRFKHRLVSIHCFPNGNGRHSRLMADIIVHDLLGRPVFTWGGASGTKGRDIRKEYLSAVKKADEGDPTPLIIFARS